MHLMNKYFPDTTRTGAVTSPICSSPVAASPLLGVVKGGANIFAPSPAENEWKQLNDRFHSLTQNMHQFIIEHPNAYQRLAHNVPRKKPLLKHSLSFESAAGSREYRALGISVDSINNRRRSSITSVPLIELGPMINMLITGLYERAQQYNGTTDKTNDPTDQINRFNAALHDICVEMEIAVS